MYLIINLNDIEASTFQLRMEKEICVDCMENLTK